MKQANLQSAAAAAAAADGSRIQRHAATGERSFRSSRSAVSRGACSCVSGPLLAITPVGARLCTASAFSASVCPSLSDCCVLRLEQQLKGKDSPVNRPGARLCGIYIPTGRKQKEEE